MEDHHHRGVKKSKPCLRKYIRCSCYCRGNITRCQTGTNAVNGVLQISFTVQYPMDCISNSCRQNFVEEIRQRIRQSDERMTLPMRYNDGRTSETAMYFCSLTLIGSSMYIVPNHSYLTNFIHLICLDVPITGLPSTEGMCFDLSVFINRSIDFSKNEYN